MQAAHIHLLLLFRLCYSCHFCIAVFCLCQTKTEIIIILQKYTVILNAWLVKYNNIQAERSVKINDKQQQPNSASTKEIYVV